MTSADTTTVDDDVGGPLYAQIADRLRQQILGGQLVAGQRLPGEFDLAQQLQVSRLTVRGALARLQADGLIVKRQGIGSFVRRTRVAQTVARLETLDTTLADQGLTSRTRILEYAFGAPLPTVAAALELPADAEILRVKRLHVVENEPIAYVFLCLPGKIGAHFSREDVEKHAFYRLLSERLGVHLGPATQTVRAEAASEETALALRIVPDRPVLVCERVTCSQDNEPIIYALFHYRAERFEFRASLSPHEWKVPWGSPGLARLPASSPEV